MENDKKIPAQQPHPVPNEQAPQRPTEPLTPGQVHQNPQIKR